MAAVLDTFPVKQETKAASLGGASPFSPISALMQAQDRGDRGDNPCVVEGVEAGRRIRRKIKLGSNAPGARGDARIVTAPASISPGSQAEPRK